QCFFRYATDSRIMRRFSSSVVRSTSVTCKSQLLPKMVMTGAPDSVNGLRRGSVSGLPFGLHVLPKAAIFACFHFIARARRKNSTSLGLVGLGQPPSM